MLTHLVRLDGSEVHRGVGDLLEERPRVAAGATGDRDTADVQAARVGGQVISLARSTAEPSSSPSNRSRTRMASSGSGASSRIRRRRAMLRAHGPVREPGPGRLQAWSEVALEAELAPCGRRGPAVWPGRSGLVRGLGGLDGDSLGRGSCRAVADDLCGLDDGQGFELGEVVAGSVKRCTLLMSNTCGESCAAMSNRPPRPTAESRAVPDQGEGRAVLVGDGEQGVGGVLVEHPGLVHHDSLPAGQSRGGGRAGGGRRRRPSSRSHDPGCPALRGGGFDRGAEHGGRARAGRAT